MREESEGREKRTEGPVDCHATAETKERRLRSLGLRRDPEFCLDVLSLHGPKSSQGSC